MAQVGELELLVIQATNLKDVEYLGRQDPFCIFELSGQKFQTKTRTDKGKHPTFNERFRFLNISSQYATEMQVKVMDRNVVTSDTLIGSARVPLARVYAARTEEMRVPLVSKKGKSAGELQLLLTWRPYGAAAGAPAHASAYAAAPAQPAAYAAAPMYAAPAPAPGYGQPAPAAYAAPPLPTAGYAYSPYPPAAPAPAAVPPYPYGQPGVAYGAGPAPGYGQPAPAYGAPPAGYYPPTYPGYPPASM